MRKVKALAALMLIGGGMVSMSHAAMHYGAVMGYIGTGWGVAFGVAAVFACAPFAGPAAIGCGLAAVG